MFSQPRSLIPFLRSSPRSIVVPEVSDCDISFGVKGQNGWQPEYPGESTGQNYSGGVMHGAPNIGDYFQASCYKLLGFDVATVRIVYTCHISADGGTIGFYSGGVSRYRSGEIINLNGDHIVLDLDFSNSPLPAGDPFVVNMSVRGSGVLSGVLDIESMELCPLPTWCYRWDNDVELLAEGWTQIINTTTSKFWGLAFEATITHVGWEYTVTVGGGDSANAWWDGAGLNSRVDLEAPVGDSPYSWDGNHVIGNGGLSWGGNDASAGIYTPTNLTLQGTGTMPAWTHGHSC